jgi:signal transduction histidine kinase
MASIWMVICYQAWVGQETGAPRTLPRLGVLSVFAFGAIFLASNLSINELSGTTWRRFLLLVGAATVIFSFAALDESAVLALLVVVSIQLAYGFRRRQAIILILAINLALAALILARQSRLAAVEQIAFYGGLQVFAFMTAGYARDVRAASDCLLRVNAELIATRALLQESSRLDERLRLSRELHDLVGYKLTALKMQLRQMAKNVSPPEQPLAESSLRLADELLADVRGVVSASRCGDGVDLHASLVALANSVPYPKIELYMADNVLVPRLEQAHALLRCAQEGVSNAIRHGNPSRIVMTLVQTETDTTMTIDDDGHGQASPVRGNGLLGLQERLQPLGGTIDFSRRDHHGYQLAIWMPLTHSLELT